LRACASSSVSEGDAKSALEYRTRADQAYDSAPAVEADHGHGARLPTAKDAVRTIRERRVDAAFEEACVDPVQHLVEAARK
jgi:hypothetical protein